MAMKTRRASPTLLALPGAVLLVLLAVAVTMPPAWAESAGEEYGNCAACHDEDLVMGFSRTVHGRLAHFEVLDGRRGCEACHGSATAHMESGDPAAISGLKGDSPEEIAKVCTGCHSGKQMFAWYGSEHQMSGVGCTDCHRIHVGTEKGRRYFNLQSPEICYQCHAEVRGQFLLPSRHPLKEGKMTCGACHDPHGNYPRHLQTDERLNDLCFNCHSAKQGPFIFEHAPVVEDCSICHVPHGSVANNLLLQTEPFLCLQCHEFHFHSAQESNEEDPVIVGDPGFERPFSNPFGTFGYKVAFTTKCSQCHTQIHGSDLPSQSLPGQGKSFTR